MGNSKTVTLKSAGPNSVDTPEVPHCPIGVQTPLGGGRAGVGTARRDGGSASTIGSRTVQATAANGHQRRRPARRSRRPWDEFASDDTGDTASGQAGEPSAAGGQRRAPCQTDVSSGLGSGGAAVGIPPWVATLARGIVQTRRVDVCQRGGQRRHSPSHVCVPVAGMGVEQPCRGWWRGCWGLIGSCRGMACTCRTGSPRSP